jgi:hypothetical protein
MGLDLSHRKGRIWRSDILVSGIPRNGLRIGGLRPSVGGYGEIDQAPAFEA